MKIQSQDFRIIYFYQLTKTRVFQVNLSFLDPKIVMIVNHQSCLKLFFHFAIHTILVLENEKTYQQNRYLSKGLVKLEVEL